MRFERIAAVAAMLALTAAPALATDAKVALVPGGPHPYFANWEQGAIDAKKDFSGIAAADYKVPGKWELGLQNQMIENLTAQGYNAFLIFPGDPVATNSPMADLQAAGIPSIATAGCTKDPTPALFCFGTAVDNSAYLGTKELIKALGGKGTIVHFTGNLVDPNTQLRMDAVAQAVKETDGKVKLLQDHRRHRPHAAGSRRQDQRAAGRARQGDRRHHHHGVAAVGVGGDRAA